MGSPSRKTTNEMSLALIDERIRQHYDRLGQAVLSDVAKRFPLLTDTNTKELSLLLKKSPSLVDSTVLTKTVRDAIKTDNEIEEKSSLVMKNHIKSLKGKVNGIAANSEKLAKNQERDRKLLKDAITKDAARTLNSDVLQRSVTQQQKVKAMLAKANTVINGHVPKIATKKRCIASLSFFRFLMDLSLIFMTIFSLIVSSYGLTLFSETLITIFRIVIDITIVSCLIFKQFIDKKYNLLVEKKETLVGQYQEAFGIIAVYGDYKNINTLASDSRVMGL